MSKHTDKIKRNGPHGKIETRINSLKKREEIKTKSKRTYFMCEQKTRSKSD